MSQAFKKFCFWLSVAVVLVNSFLLNFIAKIPLLRPMGKTFAVSALCGLVGAVVNWMLIEREKAGSG